MKEEQINRRNILKISAALCVNFIPIVSKGIYRVEAAQNTYQSQQKNANQLSPKANQDTMVRRVSVEVQWQADEWREDKKVPVSEWMVGPGTIAHGEEVTVTWSAESSISLSFRDMGLAFGGAYSESRSWTNTYTENLDTNEMARIVYVPYMHHINGWITITEGGDIIPTPLGGSIPTEVRTIVDHQWCALYFPLNGGYFALERQNKPPMKIGL